MERVTHDQYDPAGKSALLSLVCLREGSHTAVQETAGAAGADLYAVRCDDGTLGIWRHDRGGVGKKSIS